MRYDLLIVGAGPAGSSAAYHAAKAGLSTLLVDQSSFPRDKVCAGGLTVAAKEQLPEGLPAFISQTRINKLRTYLGGSSFIHSSRRPFMDIIHRAEFDYWLLSLAVQQGAFPLLGVRVNGFERSMEGVRIKTSHGIYDGRLLIAADGANSILARQILRKPRLIGYCLQTEVANQPVEADTITIHYGIVPQGYAWVFPRTNSAVVGVGGIIGHLPNPRQRLLTVMQQNALPPAAIRLQAHTIPIGGQKMALLSEGVLLAGDAAGLVDPFTGEGIRYALLSGRRAAETAVTALSQSRAPTSDLLLPYAAHCQQEIGTQLRSAFALSRIFFRFSHLAQPRLFGQEEPVEQLLEVLRGAQTYQGFIHWGLRNWPRLRLLSSH